MILNFKGSVYEPVASIRPSVAILFVEAIQSAGGDSALLDAAAVAAVYPAFARQCKLTPPDFIRLGLRETGARVIDQIAAQGHSYASLVPPLKWHAIDVILKSIPKLADEEIKAEADFLEPVTGG